MDANSRESAVQRLADSRPFASIRGLKLAESVSLEDWRATGRELMGTVGALPWWLGDWYLCGIELARAELAKEVQDSRFKGQSSEEPSHMELAAKVRQLFSAGDRAWKTALNAAVVCRAFDPSRRRDGLSFTHHESVCSLPVREQERWLNRAEKQEWSTADLREQLRESKRPQGAVSSGRFYVLTAHVQEMMRWLREQDLSEPGRREALEEELRPIVEFAEALNS